MAEDVEYIANATRLDVSVASFPWTNKKSHAAVNSNNNNNNNAGNSSQEPLSLKYFRLIGEDRIKKLYNIYKIDFEMFGYSVQQYLTEEM